MRSTPHTKAAALRLLPFAEAVETVRELKNAVQVTYQVRGGRCSTFLGKKMFIADFDSIRIASAKAIEVVEVRESGEYVVYSTTSNAQYVVHPHHDDPRQRCECGDCHYRSAHCKHQIAVEEYEEEHLSGFVS